GEGWGSCVGGECVGYVGGPHASIAFLPRFHQALVLALPARLAASAAAAAVAAESAAAAGEFRFGSGFVHRQAAAAHLILIELGSGLLRFLVSGHLDEREPARAPRRGVAHDAHRFHRAGLAEELLQFRLARRIGQIPNVKPSTHTLSSFAPRRAAGAGAVHAIDSETPLRRVVARRLSVHVRGRASQEARSTLDAGEAGGAGHQKRVVYQPAVRVASRGPDRRGYPEK